MQLVFVNDVPTTPHDKTAAAPEIPGWELVISVTVNDEHLLGNGIGKVAVACPTALDSDVKPH